MSNTNELLNRINNHYSAMSKGQKLLATYITDNYDKAVFLTAAKMGETVGVSESTVVRFATSLGYKGYPEFQKALEEFSESQQYAFDCILMDIMMPVMNGIEATKKIRSLNRDDAKTIPIIALSANTVLKDETNQDLSGINGYIEKPIYVKKLLATINSFCNMK
mgnify:CR=1 FL=1